MYIYPYSLEWKHLYLLEEKSILEKVSINFKLHHIGSTSVVDMYAKGCVDILGVVESFEAGRVLIPLLESLGYIYRGEYGIANRHYFVKKNPDNFHLHIFPHGSKEIEKHLKFCRVMAQYPELVKEFIEIKLTLQNKYPHDKDRYQEEKSFFYAKVASIKERVKLEQIVP